MKWSLVLLVLCVGILLQACAPVEEVKTIPTNESSPKEELHQEISFLVGPGNNIDSLAFTEDGSTLYVTAKGNNVVEIWIQPFDQAQSLSFSGSPNGVVVQDQIVYISTYNPSEVIVVENNNIVNQFGKDIIGKGDVNLAADSEYIYVTDKHNVYVFDYDYELAHTIAVNTSSVETIAIDAYHNTIHVPEEKGNDGKNPGVHVFDRSTYTFVQRYGVDVFEEDAEGIAIIPCNDVDDGSGVIVVVDQKRPLTDFEIFDRQTYEHLETLNIEGIAQTDGIAYTHKSVDHYTQGVFAAVDNDRRVALVPLQRILGSCGE